MADNETFMRLWTQAEPTVAGYVSSMVRDFHVCEDLLQEIAVVLLRKFDEYDSKRPFVSWALGVARLEILTSRRSHARSRLSFREDLLQAVSEAYEELAPELGMRAIALRKCLEIVGGRNRQVLELRYAQALKPRQIASELGLAAGNIRVILNRIRNTLRECVERKLSNEVTQA